MRNTGEIDFVVGAEDKVIPVEVKTEVNPMAESLKSYREKYSPKVAVRLSMADYEKQDGLIKLPRCAADVMRTIKA